MKNKEAILFIGLPGAGKTWEIANRNYHQDYNLVSADEIKLTLKGYDPKNPNVVQEESVKKAEQEVYALADKGKNICMDSGGVNNSYSLRIIKNLRDRGYWVKLIYVNTPLSICLERNKNRERVVPESIITSKSEKIDSCFLKQKEVADEVEVITYTN